MSNVIPFRKRNKQELPIANQADGPVKVDGYWYWIDLYGDAVGPFATKRDALQDAQAKCWVDE